MDSHYKPNEVLRDSSMKSKTLPRGGTSGVFNAPNENLVPWQREIMEKRAENLVPWQREMMEKRAKKK